jgi:hypothetical protein
LSSEDRDLEATEKLMGVTARATPISDPAEVEQILDKFRAKYGAQAVETYYPRHDAAVEVPLA